MQKTRICSFLDTVSVWTILLVPVVAVLGFIPYAPLWVDGAKVLVSSILITISVAAYLLSGLLARKISLPHRYLMLGSGLYIISAFLSSLFVKGGQTSFFGIGIEAWTVTYILLTLLFLGLVSIHAQNPVVRKRLLSVLVVVSTISVLFQLVRVLTLNAFGSFSIFGDVIINTIGRWSDLGIVTLGLILTTTLVFAIHAKSTYFKVITVVLFAIFVTLFSIISPLVGLILLSLGALFLRYRVLDMNGMSIQKNITAKVLFIIAIISFAAFIFQGITGKSPLFFESNNIPTLSQTRADIVYQDFPSTFIRDSLVVARATVKESPVFGVGASRFQEAWVKYRPISTNETIWWSVDFSVGGGMFLTVFVMFGILGALGFSAFLLLIFRSLYRAILSADVVEKTTGLLATIFWAYALVQTPSVGFMLVLFTLTGVALSFRRESSVLFTKKTHITLVSLVALLLLVLPVYGTSTRTVALAYALQGERLISSGPVLFDQAKQSIERAAIIVPHEIYFQALATIEQRNLSNLYTKIANRETPESEREALNSQFNTSLRAVTETYGQAIAANDKNYLSYVRRAQFFSNLLGQAEDGDIFNAAISDVQKARELAPSNATIDVLEAQIYLAKENSAEAQKLLLDALKKKPNYTEAAITIAQINTQNRNLKDALSAAEYAVRTNINNSQALYVYGILQFEAKNYTLAVQAFERLMTIQGGVSREVATILATSYVEIGSFEQAREAYKVLLKDDPANEEIKASLLKIQEATSTSPIGSPEE